VEFKGDGVQFSLQRIRPLGSGRQNLSSSDTRDFSRVKQKLIFDVQDVDATVAKIKTMK